MKALLPAAHYDLFSVSDGIFYDSPDRMNDLDSRFDASGRPAPEGWQKKMIGLWVRLFPPDAGLPDQGWKLHVSATPRDAERVVDTVWSYCHQASLPFKFLRSRAATLLLNGKYANRSSSGKLVTIYLRDEEALHTTLRGLGPALEGIPGPYILSDLRHRDGPLFVRYGGFRDMWCVDEHGERVPAIQTPSGEYVPDVRRPRFSLPDFVALPHVLEPDVARQGSVSAGALPYEVERALHFSNAGGVYLARSAPTATALSSARPGRMRGWMPRVLMRSRACAGKPRCCGACTT